MHQTARKKSPAHSSGHLIQPGWLPPVKEPNMKLIKKFVRNESGATAIEYGLIAGGISIVIIGGIALAGPQLEATFTSISTALTP